MPLPSALLSRLKKRGIVEDENKNEEVFAEDYDDADVEDGTPIPVETKTQLVAPKSGPIYDLGILVHDQSNCCNQSNIYHKCSSYCYERYGRRKFNFDPISARLRDRMLRKYPLPSHWMEVGDPSTGRFYYWNTRNDEVCWLSPLHPRAKITKPAEVLRELMIEEREMEPVAKKIHERSRHPRSDEDDSDYDDNLDRRRAPDRRRRDSVSSRDSMDSGPRSSRRRRRQWGSRDSDNSYEEHRRRKRSSESDSNASDRDRGEYRQDYNKSRRYPESDEDSQ